MMRRLAGRIQQEHDALAPVYDQRWRRYLDKSLDATLARLPLAGNESILDVGCGSGELLRRLRKCSPDLLLAGVDPSPGMLAVARHKLGADARVCNASAESLPFSDDTFDRVACTSVLHYWPEPVHALAEIRRVLKPGGRLVLTDWCGDYASSRLIAWRLRLLRRPLARVYRGSDCRQVLAEASFKVQQLDRYKVGGWWGLMTVIAG